MVGVSCPVCQWDGPCTLVASGVVQCNVCSNVWAVRDE